MTEIQDQRRTSRHELHLTNAVRLITAEGDCLADVRDLSEEGMGIEYFDFFCSLDLSPGTELTVRLMPTRPEREECRARVSTAFHDTRRPDDVHCTDADSLTDDSEETPLCEVRGRVLWQHLNRVGIEFINESATCLVDALVEQEQAQEHI